MSTTAGTVETIPVDSIVFRPELYPRVKKNDDTVQRYAEDLEVLPPIEINQHRELIDGWHRVLAHKQAGTTEIRAIVRETANDDELLEWAIERNSTHGLQLSHEEKRKMARRIYSATPHHDREAKKAHLANVLSVSERTLRDWLSQIDKDATASRNRRIADMWMACRTQAEIAEACQCSQSEVSKSIPNGDLAEWNDSEQSAAAHATDFEPPLYNIFREPEKTAETAHCGTAETRILDYLLYLYTVPFDIVVDVFARSGSTIDVCKKRLRRYWVSDPKPAIERGTEIRQWDIAQGLPSLPRWKDVRLVYLDPPYWGQAEAQYSTHPTDLADMPLEQFTKTLTEIVSGFGRKLTKAYIALVMQPTQWDAPEHRYTDHVADMLRAVNLTIDMRFSAPIEPEHCTPPMVHWAKENRRCLVLTREIVVWRIDK